MIEKIPRPWGNLIRPCVAGQKSGMPKRGYHHGNLRQALVDAALRLIEAKGPTGFTLSEAAKQAGVTPAAVYRHFAGRDDLIFARQYPGHYIAMFESGISINRTPQLAQEAARARAILERAADTLCQQIPAEKRPSAAVFSAHIWALSHGVVELFARNSPGTASSFVPEDLLESGIGIYLRGLGVIAPDD